MWIKFLEVQSKSSQSGSLNPKARSDPGRGVHLETTALNPKPPNPQPYKSCGLSVYEIRIHIEEGDFSCPTLILRTL